MFEQARIRFKSMRPLAGCEREVQVRSCEDAFRCSAWSGSWEAPSCVPGCGEVRDGEGVWAETRVRFDDECVEQVQGRLETCSGGSVSLADEWCVVGESLTCVPVPLLTSVACAASVGSVGSVGDGSLRHEHALWPAIVVVALAAPLLALVCFYFVKRRRAVAAAHATQRTPAVASVHTSNE